MFHAHVMLNTLFGTVISNSLESLLTRLLNQFTKCEPVLRQPISAPKNMEQYLFFIKYKVSPNNLTNSELIELPH